MKKTITYGQLFRELRELGFALKKIESDDRRQLVFTHSQDDTATFLLPDMYQKESVRSYHLAVIKAVLKSHGIAPANGEPVML